MTNPPETSATSEKRSNLFDFWDELPNVAMLELPSKLMSSHKVRPAILKILREGLEDSGRIRHGLNVKEIKGLLQEIEGINMSQTNLYFHLGVLEKNGLIKIVERITEGRHKVAYYGRTAKGIITRDPEESLENYRKRFMWAGRFAKVENPEINLDQMMLLADEYLRTKQRRDKALGKWLSNHEEKISSHNISFYELFEFIKTLDSVNPEYVAFLRKVAEILKIELESEKHT